MTCQTGSQRPDQIWKNKRRCHDRYGSWKKYYKIPYHLSPNPKAKHHPSTFSFHPSRFIHFLLQKIVCDLITWPFTKIQTVMSIFADLGRTAEMAEVGEGERNLSTQVTNDLPLHLLLVWCLHRFLAMS
jgi:hypothetical protein